MVLAPPLAISIANLLVSYQGKTIFDQFVLDLPAGKWSTILGASGVGKSTLLRFMAGLNFNNDTVHSGQMIASDNQPLTNRVAYMTQEDSLLDWLNVYDNLLIGYRLRGIPVTAQLNDKANILLHTVGVDGMANLMPKQLSAGMRQRVALARTLLEDRDLILMDEPFSALDPVTRLNIQDLATSLLRGRTVVLVTHDPLEALRISDQVMILAGLPAKIDYKLDLATSFPRDVASPNLLQDYAYLLQRLRVNAQN